ncbi:probable pre-mRNA-splicing factor ATP-dependent RNA helicase DEAH6 [Malus sylvestris]|uniref:probable pre-mRNA-splicing factor ATP-dependent RNA helicase DEAH6 n=1 Tax=Malus sylvestris TaxID=3752 RepID=UPI0021AC8371|nr:probable pre-mRNA-splicing factor ATP-dependent RNA helicase DEAH6 [Malus sylvestris]
MRPGTQWMERKRLESHCHVESLMSCQMLPPKLLRRWESSLDMRGRNKIEYMHTLEDGYELVDLVVTQTLVLHVMEAPGDILVFLPGQQEIETFDHSLKQIIIAHGHTQLITCPISAEVLEPTPQGVRKVVLATSPAEISWLMLNSIQYFIDSGLCKMKSYDLMAGKELDRMSPVSKAEATQRAELGLAGSTCYRLYTNNFYEGLQENTTPEVLRRNLVNVVLVLN